MPKRELFHHIPLQQPYTFDHPAEACRMESAQTGLQTAMLAADQVRQKLTILRNRLLYPNMGLQEPQNIIDVIDNDLSALIYTQNDRIIAIKLNLPDTPEEIKKNIASMPHHLRLSL